MPEFLNTVDVVGDEVLICSIIDRSVTEIKDDVLASIGDYAFYNCSALTEVNLPTVTSIGVAAFANCPTLKSVELPQVKSLGAAVFSGCSSLTELDFPELNNLAGNNEFKGCLALTNVKFNKLTQLPSANSSSQAVFALCAALKKVDVPSVTSVGHNVFNNGCSALTAFILRSGTMATLVSANAFNNTPIASGTGYIYVPAALVDTYKANSKWSTYANQFRALEDYTVDGTTTGELDETKI